MAHRRNNGQPVQILRLEDERRLSLDTGALQQILLADDVKDLPVAVVSVAGRFREGKSFLLNFFLRHMRNRTQEDWMGDTNAPLEGFSWRGGSNRETTGILMWNEVFVVTTTEGRKVAVIFLDTQGTFDCMSTMNGAANIFALSMMASSVQIYNVSKNIGEDHLQNLQLFAQYGRLALQATKEKPFQKLLFVVRDSPGEDNCWGFEGGNDLVQQRLQITEGQAAELKNLRMDVCSCFTEISGFLMPYPGNKVTSMKNFDGRLSDIGNDFKVQLQKLVSSVLKPNNLVAKKICGCEISCKELFDHIKTYARMFENGTLPEARTMLEANVEGHNSRAVDRAVDEYRNNMEKVFHGERPYLDSEMLQKEHLRVKESALHLFDEQSKLGGEARSKQHKARLEKLINQQFESFLKRNEGERIKAEEQKIMDAARRKAKSIVDEAEDRRRRIEIAAAVSGAMSLASLGARAGTRVATAVYRRLATAVQAGATVGLGASAAYITAEVTHGALKGESTSDGDKKKE